ncbi:probable UDP-N-acetylglucosamine--peptide N-acetylglucosaminyltransferase SEC [Tanacetum coccineum]
MIGVSGGFVSAMTFDTVARLINEDQIQILINLNGYTKPTPIHVSYMGCPDTTGASYIQYLATNEFVSPIRFAHICTSNVCDLDCPAMMLCLFCDAIGVPMAREFFDATRVLVMLGSKLLMQDIFSIFDDLVRTKAQEQDDLLLWLKRKPKKFLESSDRSGYVDGVNFETTTLKGIQTLLSELSNEVGFPVTNTSFDDLLESLLSTAKLFPQSTGYRILTS